MFGQEEESV
jgi:hypothetical protein